MSFISGEGHDDGDNEDDQGEAAVRDSEARLFNEGVNIWRDSDDDSEAQQQEEVDVLEDPDEDVDVESELQDRDDVVSEDYIQLRGKERHVSEDLDPDAGPVTPISNMPLASPVESESIPDDTPSQPGSLLSSPSRGVSPIPRRSVSRTPSSALQPFERRFEARTPTSPSASPKANFPAFLSPHSRQISLTSQISQISSQDGETGTETPQAPWDVIRWTKLRKITSKAFSESGKRSFGRPTCMAVSALIAIGTSKGLILGFDYHQTLKIIIGPGTKATECGSVTAIAIAADYSTIAGGHANGHIFTWEINRPARPFLQVPPLEGSVLNQSQHPDGHLSNCAIIHVGFLGTRRTALVSADAGGMAFSHLATRGLGPVTRTVKTTRLLGRYPPSDPEAARRRKPSSVLAFAPLPLGNVEQRTDSMSLTALLTPYLLVIVSTTPIAQTQYKSARPKDISPHSLLSGCLAWFPAVKLKGPNANEKQQNSATKLVYCWSNIMTVLDVRVAVGEEPDDPQKPPGLEFHPRRKWRADESIVAIQWLGRSVLGVLTVSQRLLIVEDGSLQVTDSIDLLHRNIYHQDVFSHQLQSVVEQLQSAEPGLHGIVADAFSMSFKAYKGRTFLLGFNDLTVGTLSNWADRLMALMEAGDHIAAIKLATEYYNGSAINVTIGLPTSDAGRHEMVKERLLAMVSASLNYTFSQHDDGRDVRLRDLAEVCFNACISMEETDYLFDDVFEWFQDADEESIFITTLEHYVLDGDVTMLPPSVVKALVSYFISENLVSRLEELICRLDAHSFDLDQVTTLCRQHSLYDALIYIWTQGIGDFVTPFVDLLALVKMLQHDGEDEDMSQNLFFVSALKTFPYLAYTFTGRRYPKGDIMDNDEASQAKGDLYGYLFAGTPTAWPRGSKNIFHSAAVKEEEPAFPYLDLLLRFDTASVMSMLNEAFEDSFLNETYEESSMNGPSTVNGADNRQASKMSRHHIVSIMRDVMREPNFEPEQIIFLDMFIARNIPKYPGQLILPGSFLANVLERLCHPPLDELREDCQLSIEYLLSAYHPPDISTLIGSLREARFFRMLKSVYRSERMYSELLETYFEDPEDKEGVFECISFCLRSTTGLNNKQLHTIKQLLTEHIHELADIDTALTSRTLATYAPELLEPSLKALSDSQQRLVYLRAILEPALLRDGRYSSSPLPPDQQSPFTGEYVQLMCQHDPTHVAGYIGLLPSSDLRLEQVLPAMESSGVIDAAVVLLARDGLARDAMDRLVNHMTTLCKALTGLVEAATSSPDVDATQEASSHMVEEIEKYTKVGIWLCQGQTASIQRSTRSRAALSREVKEDDLDLDEYLWLNLLDVVVQVNQNVAGAIAEIEQVDIESAANTFDSMKVDTALRNNVQQAFTTLLTATAAPGVDAQSNAAKASTKSPDHMSFLRILRTFLTRASKTTPSLSDLRAILSDIFMAYTFEQGVLSLANELLGSDVFIDIDEANQLRQRGWRPRSQVCEQCKRRAWGTSIGEPVWNEWVQKEGDREADKARKMIERGGGEVARRMERGKAKATASQSSTVDTKDSEESRRLALVVFACRHVFHRVCIDERYRDGKPLTQERYKCPLCADAEQ